VTIIHKSGLPRRTKVLLAMTAIN